MFVDFDTNGTFGNVPDATSTTMTEYGDIYDCIDFYKQPAFDHALLKSHEFHPEMRPSNMNGLEEVGKEEEKEEGDNEIEVECPHGTVPIRRTTKEDLIRQKTFNQMFDSNIHPLTDSEPGLHVNPTLYGDNRCRKFAYFHTRDQHCFNTNCPGFVIVNNNSPLDYAFPKVSEIAVRIMECRFYIYRDPQNGNWWLVTGKGKKQKALGFWPAKLFTDLAYNADEVYWGGELFTIPNSKTSPMGNGLLIKHVDDPRLYAYARDCSVVDAKTQKAIGVAEVNSEEVTDFDGWYGRRKAHIEKYWGHTIMFGGPAKLIKEWSGEKDTITKDMKKNQTLSRNQNQTEAFSYPKNSRNEELALTRTDSDENGFCHYVYGEMFWLWKPR
ncbi:hypothetical protein Bca101_095526 [Brassica carinata]